MHVISVAPIKRGIPVDELSYFTKEVVPRGALVTVPLRNRLTPALVIRSAPAGEMKGDIKHANFSIKKLERVHAKNFFRPEFITACEETANYFASTTGAVIHSLFPSALILSKKVANTLSPSDKKRHGERYIFQAEEAERYATYKSHIREVFARGESCYFILPTVQDIEHAFASIEKGIQEYTFILHAGLTKRELESRWQKIMKMEHPVLIIGTPLFLSVPRHDIASIILDRESAGTYTLQTRPYIDLRFFAEVYAKAIGADLYLGDLFLRTETLYRKSAGEFETLIRPKSRLPSQSIGAIVDMRKSGEQPAIGKVAVISHELVLAIEGARRSGDHAFVLGVRRGYAPMTVCGDCGTVVTCTHCSAPLVLHKRSGESGGKDKEPFSFLCHRCGREGDTGAHCAYCKGWRLTPLGMGVSQAVEALRKRFPEGAVFQLDRDIAKKHSDAQEIMKKFYETPGSILVGTEMALPYLTSPVATVGVLSVNSLLTIPDFRMEERVFRLLISLREKARDRFIVQTRDTKNPLFARAVEGNIGEFLRNELSEREAFSYPPFSTLIKFTHEGGRAEGNMVMKEIEKLFGAFHPVTFPSFIGKVRGKYRMNALLKLKKNEWPNPDLLELIHTLSPDIAVRVNPESVI